VTEKDVGGSAEGDPEAWLSEAYATAYRTAVLILHNRAEAEEAVQDALLRAWRFRDSVSEPALLRPWLYRIVVNTCCSALRRQSHGRDRRAEEPAFGALASPAPSPEDTAPSPTWRGASPSPWPACPTPCASRSSSATTRGSRSVRSRWQYSGARAR